MNREQLEAQLAELPLLQYEFFSTADLEFSDRIRYLIFTIMRAWKRQKSVICPVQ